MSLPRASFNKKELNLILKVYGKMVSIGEWRDYAISLLKDISVFSIYRHSSEFPIYRVKKFMKKSNKKEIFTVVEMNGKILRSGNNLSDVLKPLEMKIIRRVK